MTASLGTAVVTGAAHGIGKATARHLAAAGYDLLLVDRESGPVEEAAAELGGRSAVIDVADAAAMEQLAELAPECTALVNNVGITMFTPLLETSDADAARTFAVNVLSILSGARVLAPVIAGNGGGSIVNLSSVTAAFHPPTTGVYSATKGAVEALTRALAVELGPLGIRCNAVAPGTVPTEGTADHYGTGAVLASRVRPLPIQRLGTVDDIAGAVAFFCSPEASYITGQIVAVDGGYLAAGGVFYRLARTAP